MMFRKLTVIVKQTNKNKDIYMKQPLEGKTELHL